MWRALIFNTLKFTLQALYDYTATLAQTATGNSHTLQTAQPMMPQLHVEGFDAEQIWLQLDMASAHVVRRARRLLKKAGNEPELLTPEMDEDLEGGNSNTPHSDCEFEANTGHDISFASLVQKTLLSCLQTCSRVGTSLGMTQ